MCCYKAVMLITGMTLLITTITQTLFSTDPFCRVSDGRLWAFVNHHCHNSFKHWPSAVWKAQCVAFAGIYWQLDKVTKKTNCCVFHSLVYIHIMSRSTSKEAAIVHYYVSTLAWMWIHVRFSDFHPDITAGTRREIKWDVRKHGLASRWPFPRWKLDERKMFAQW